MNIQYNESIQQGSFDQDKDVDLDFIENSRNNFIRKVYSIVTIQLIATAIFTFITVFWPEFREFQEKNFGLWVLNFIIMIGIEIAIFCCPAGRQHPTNLILLGIFTVCQSYVVSYFCSYYFQIIGGNIILQAVCLTAAMVAALTVFAFTTKKDFTIYLGIMFVLGCSLFILGLLSIFTNNEALYNFYLFAGVLLFGAYLVIDTQLIMGGKTYGLTLDDYVVGALFLYIDIIALFLRILIILGKLRK